MRTPSLRLKLSQAFGKQTGRISAVDVFEGQITNEFGPNNLDPLGRNLYHVRVINPDGAASPLFNWQALSVE